MDGDVDASVEKRVLDLLGEETLAADFREIAVLHAVAGRLDDDDLARLLGRTSERGADPGGDVMRLDQSEFRAACADA
jgi:hypothetical protein